MRANKNCNMNNDVVNSNMLIDNSVAINDIHNPDIESKEEVDCKAVEVTLTAKMNFVRQIWLAGLGAYGNSVDELNIAGEKSSIFFEELLCQGRKVDKKFKLHTAGEYISLHGLEKLIQRTYAKLTGIEGRKITQLNNKLDALITLLEEDKK